VLRVVGPIIGLSNVTAAHERPQSAIRLEDYKLIKYWDNDERLLFDLGRDIGEQENLVLKMPEKAEELHRRLMEYLQGARADIPGRTKKR
jgi:hypothetical protein